VTRRGEAAFDAGSASTLIPAQKRVNFRAARFRSPLSAGSKKMKVLTAVLTFAFVCSSAVLPAGAQEKKKADAKPQQSTPTKEAQAAQPQQQPPATTEPVLPVVPPQAMYTARGEYVLGLGDVLQLKVYGEPQFDGDLTVEEDGQIVVPFSDSPIPARCRKVNAVRKDVITALAVLLKNPKVDLRVKDRVSRRPAVVYGAVRDPQKFDMQRPARLLELLSNAGGVTEQHSGTIQIVHTEPPMCEEDTPANAPSAKVKTGEDALGIPFEIYRVADLRQGLPEANPYLRNGDIIYVAEASPIYIVGNVVQPANLYLREGMTLTRALATVGGVRDANESKVRIHRLNQQTMKQDVVTVDYKAIKANKAKDVPLQPYDIIEVPKAGFGVKDIRDMVLGVARQGALNTGAVLPTRILY
jgi:polysaccharide biosynthesis/export protein